MKQRPERAALASARTWAGLLARARSRAPRKASPSGGTSGDILSCGAGGGIAAGEKRAPRPARRAPGGLRPGGQGLRRDAPVVASAGPDAPILCPRREDRRFGGLSTRTLTFKVRGPGCSVPSLWEAGTIFAPLGARAGGGGSAGSGRGPGRRVPPRRGRARTRAWTRGGTLGTRPRVGRRGRGDTSERRAPRLARSLFKTRKPRAASACLCEPGNGGGRGAAGEGGRGRGGPESRYRDARPSAGRSRAGAATTGARGRDPTRPRLWAPDPGPNPSPTRPHTRPLHPTATPSPDPGPDPDPGPLPRRAVTPDPGL